MKLNLLKQAISFRDILTGLSVTLGLLPLVAQQLPENVFINVTVGPVVTEQEGTLGFGWADYDADGYLELLVANSALDSNPQVRCSLYHNQGDGTFTESFDSPLATKTGSYGDALWGDFDNDGFLDLFIGSGNGVPQPNYLYRNNLPNEGNANGWLKVRFQGTVSNRSGIGAKVRAQAVIRGQSVRQLRELACAGASAGGQQGVELHFGLGDATKVDVLRIHRPWFGGWAIKSSISSASALWEIVGNTR